LRLYSEKHYLGLFAFFCDVLVTTLHSLSTGGAACNLEAINNIYWY